MPPRWKRCVQYVDRNLGEALGQVFVKRTFTADDESSHTAMTKEIEKAMESDVEQFDWMSRPPNSRRSSNCTSIVNKVGYPDKWRDYGPVEIDRGDFTGNVE